MFPAFYRKDNATSEFPLADRNSLRLSSLCNQERVKLTFKRLYSTTTKDRLNARALPKKSNQNRSTIYRCILHGYVFVYVCKREKEGGRGSVLHASVVMEIIASCLLKPGKIGLKASRFLDSWPKKTVLSRSIITFSRKGSLSFSFQNYSSSDHTQLAKWEQPFKRGRKERAEDQNQSKVNSWQTKCISKLTRVPVKQFTMEVTFVTMIQNLRRDRVTIARSGRERSVPVSGVDHSQSSQCAHWLVVVVQGCLAVCRKKIFQATQETLPELNKSHPFQSYEVLFHQISLLRH